MRRPWHRRSVLGRRVGVIFGRFRFGFHRRGRVGCLPMGFTLSLGFMLVDVL